MHPSQARTNPGCIPSVLSPKNVVADVTGVTTVDTFFGRGAPHQILSKLEVHCDEETRAPGTQRAHFAQREWHSDDFGLRWAKKRRPSTKHFDQKALSYRSTRPMVATYERREFQFVSVSDAAINHGVSRT